MKTARLLIVASALALAACAGAMPAATPPETAGAWPVAVSPTPRDEAMEARIATIVSQMTLAQKVGQITQPDVRYITPEEVTRYYIGSVLNGGGAWPAMNKDASVSDWAAHTRAYHEAALRTDMAIPVPLIWGTDAVHGHNNVRGATLFPHNIGLGAANDPELIERIGRATAQQVRATGIGWVFAPTVAVSQDRRWGRTYESYSSDPDLVARYAAALVRGLQGDLTGDGDVVATAKHFLGDGGTFQGVDQGEARVTEADLVRVHAPGYYTALEAGAQTVMATYNSWTDVGSGTVHGKVHGSAYLLDTVLKGRMGFDGVVVSDWNAIEQVPGCRKDWCPQAINAGIDMVMVPEDWRSFIVNTIRDVEEGRIPMARLDDAVTRILRVKMRAGLFNQPIADGRWTGDAQALDFSDLAREAVRRSAVLLKNEGAALPLASDARVLVVGASADSLSNQTGGWSRTWQGTENTNADFATGETLLMALRNALGADRVTYAPDARGVDPAAFDAVIAVIGETPYAEYHGDVRFPTPVQHSRLHPADLAVLQAVSGRGAPVVTVLYSGRPAYANDLINLSDAFVAAFLPGTEGDGLADLLVGGRHDFSGRLSFAWPGDSCATGERPGDQVQFARGFGLSYARPRPTGRLPEPAAPAACPQ